ncbi:PIG-L family deacetylase [Echinicola jeungdonensis]|uniref:PIG-L family deacetylase n=1 Tax=Echinicola jeungdonensis TaxID=709343 RepID=A0ABV5J5H6_9BACT|nr:PIG-L family deacetylase [Echinicola jeungdonensis]MDN3670890.1 PIG-L family deacetylase [Echinicola jeungdonensis]
MKYIYSSFLVIATFLTINPLFSKSPELVPSSKIYHELLRLKATHRVLYIAAHPDDENTRLIAYLANKTHGEVAYLSLTRGDGGQNLIGKELGIGLGMIRTQELLKAREIDGGRQFFTRAIDFGYSKNPDETLNNWDKEKLLSDVVWIIRNFQPDIIINRFNTTPGFNHGHHTTSAILSTEAFDKAADPAAFPEQLQYVNTWKAKRIFWNAYHWGRPYQPDPDKKSYAFTVGEYNPILGTTYAQIAAESRTMHKSQGFGSTASLGDNKDYIELIDGANFNENPFEGIPNKWSKIEGGETIENAIKIALKEYDFKNPSKNISFLLNIKNHMKKVKDKPIWLKEKEKSLEDIILKSLGVQIEYLANKEKSFQGQEVETTLLVNNPSGKPLQLSSFQVLQNKIPLEGKVRDNEVKQKSFDITIPNSFPISQPYWLKSPPVNNLYQIENQKEIGKPFNDPSISGKLYIEIDNCEFEINVPLQYKYNDPVKGEVNQTFTIIPEVTVNVDQEQVYLLNNEPKTVKIEVSFANGIKNGELILDGLNPDAYQILEEKKSPEKGVSTFLLKVNGSTPLGKTKVNVQFKTEEGKIYDKGIDYITHNHIPKLTWFPYTQFDLIKLNLRISEQKIGYIKGAGDDVPEVLANLGYDVTILEEGSLTLDKFKDYSTIIVGIRAFNVNKSLNQSFEELMQYVEDGGNLIVQYNTTASLMRESPGPFSFSISRNRVAVEDSPVKVDFDVHKVLQYPNKIVMEDFNNWNQERGLYFPDQWDDRYVTPITMNDPGENPTQGSLLLANYGSGTYTYSSISWFRLLPAGVPGAIKLFVNLIEQGNE